MVIGGRATSELVFIVTFDVPLRAAYDSADPCGDPRGRFIDGVIPCSEKCESGVDTVGEKCFISFNAFECSVIAASSRSKRSPIADNEVFTSILAEMLASLRKDTSYKATHLRCSTSA